MKCACAKDDRRRAVLRRNYSISAFNGYRREWSDFDVVHCNACGREWRTKGDDVGLLPNAEEPVE